MKLPPLFLKTGSALLLSLVLSLTACTESIDEGNFTVKTEQTIAEYLADQPEQFSDIKSVFDRVRLGRSEQASTLSNVLSARGNYTLFAPDNTAMRNYLRGLGVSSVDELTYEQAELIAKSCLLDNGEAQAYEEADFPRRAPSP